MRGARVFASHRFTRRLARCAVVVTWFASGCFFPDVTARGDGGVPGSPEVTIAFPGVTAATDATSIIIRGTATDPDGVAALEVNGVRATSDDEFATWSATVPLDPGANEIEIAAEDGQGIRDPRSVVISVWRTVAPVFSPESIAVDEPGGVALVTDIGGGQVVAIDLATNVRRVLSDADVGEGPPIGLPRAVALDIPGNRALVATISPPQLLAIDLATGDRTRLGITAPTFDQPVSVVHDAKLELAFVLDRGLGALIAVDLVNGSGFIMSQGAIGGGPALATPNDMVHDVPDDRVLVVDDGLRAVVAISLATGARTILSDDARGTGPVFAFPGGIDLQPGANRAVVTDGELGALIAVDLVSGNRTSMSNDATGLGPVLRVPLGIGFRPLTGQFLVGDGELQTVLAVDPATGDREIMGEVSLGAGPTLGLPAACALDAERDRFLVVDTRLAGGQDGIPRAAVVAIDRARGDRSVLSGAGAGSGPELVEPTSIAVEPGDGNPTPRAFVGDAGQAAIFAVDLLSGNRTVVTGAGTGDGPALQVPAGIFIDAPEARLFVTDREAATLLSVDLATGERTLLSGAGRGQGVAFDRPEAVAFDGPRGRVVVGDTGARLIIAVDLVTGDRTVLSIPAVQPRAFQLVGADLYVLDSALSTLLRVDLVGLQQTVIADSRTGAGPRMFRPDGFALDPLTGRAIAASGARILSIDVLTGQRAVVSGAY